MMFKDLRSIFLDLIPDMVLNQKRHTHMGPSCNSSGVMRF